MGYIFPVASLKASEIRKYSLHLLPCYKKNLHPLNLKTINARVLVHLGFSSTKQYSRIARRKNYKGAGNRTFWLVRFDYRYLNYMITQMVLFSNIFFFLLSYNLPGQRAKSRGPRMTDKVIKIRLCSPRQIRKLILLQKKPLYSRKIQTLQRFTFFTEQYLLYPLLPFRPQ